MSRRRKSEPCPDASRNCDLACSVHRQWPPGLGDESNVDRVGQREASFFAVGSLVQVQRSAGERDPVQPAIESYARTGLVLTRRFDVDLMPTRECRYGHHAL